MAQSGDIIRGGSHEGRYCGNFVDQWGRTQHIIERNGVQTTVQTVTHVLNPTYPPGGKWVPEGGNR